MLSRVRLEGDMATVDAFGGASNCRAALGTSSLQGVNERSGLFVTPPVFARLHSRRCQVEPQASILPSSHVTELHPSDPSCHASFRGDADGNSFSWYLRAVR